MCTPEVRKKVREIEGERQVEEEKERGVSETRERKKGGIK